MEKNPFAPGAGHSPPHLAGREGELREFVRHLEQDVVLKNVILTGLRGTGKTVLMDDKYRPSALARGWAWVGSDFAESSFLSEDNFCLRLLTDLSVFTSTLSLPRKKFGFGPKTAREVLDFDFLVSFYRNQAGLTVDKLKATLEFVWDVAKSKTKIKGIVLAYDEAQVVGDRPEKDEYPLAVLLETFQSLQRKGAKYLLLLTGLPTLFPRLVDSRTYAERMFAVQEIGRLPKAASREAIVVPTKGAKKKFTAAGIQRIIEVSDGYPYFLQFICKESFDHFLLNPKDKALPIDAIMRKLDSDFFAGRWENLSDRQRDLLYCVSRLQNAEQEFTISEIVDISMKLDVKAFSAGDVSQVLPRLIDKGLVYKNRLGRYCFAVPLFSRFIRRKFAKTPQEFQDALS
jgi:hypothetical protein